MEVFILSESAGPELCPFGRAIVALSRDNAVQPEFRMKKAGGILGIIGGVFGVFAALITQVRRLCAPNPAGSCVVTGP